MYDILSKCLIYKIYKPEQSVYAADEQNILTLRSQRNITQPKNNFVRKGVSLSEVHTISLC